MKKVEQYVYGELGNGGGYGVVARSIKKKFPVRHPNFHAEVGEHRLELTYIEKEDQYCLAYEKMVEKGAQEDRPQLLAHCFLMDREAVSELLSDEKVLSLTSLRHIESRDEVDDKELVSFDLEKDWEELKEDSILVGEQAQALAGKLKKYILGAIFSEKTYVSVDKLPEGVSPEELIIAVMLKIPAELRRFVFFHTNVQIKEELNEYTKFAIFASPEVAETNGPMMERLSLEKTMPPSLEVIINKYFQLSKKEREKITSTAKTSQEVAAQIEKTVKKIRVTEKVNKKASTANENANVKKKLKTVKDILPFIICLGVIGVHTLMDSIMFHKLPTRMSLTISIPNVQALYTLILGFILGMMFAVLFDTSSKKKKAKENKKNEKQEMK